MIVKILEYLKQLNTRSKLIGSVILVAFVISMLVFQTISIKELNSAINREEQALNIATKRLNYLQSIKSDYPKYLQKLSALEASIPSSLSEESILTSLQQTSEESLTDFTKINFGKSSVGDGLTQLSLAISFSGNFYRLLDLLYKINSGSRIVRFDSLNISKEKGKNNLIAEIQAVSFYTSSPNSTDTKATQK